MENSADPQQFTAPIRPTPQPVDGKYNFILALWIVRVFIEDYNTSLEGTSMITIAT